MNGNLFARLAAGFPAERQADFLETAAGEGWSVGRVLDLAGRMTTVLRAAGVAPGDRVAAQVATSPEAVCLYLACLQAGAVFAPLDPGYAPSELAWLLDDLEPRLAVCDPEAEAAVAGAARAARAAVYTLGADGSGRLVVEAAALPSDRWVARRAGGDLALILRSAAGDGRPRGVMLTHDNLWSNLAALHWLWGLRPGDVVAQALPLHRWDGLAVALNLGLLNGGGILLAPGAKVARLSRATVLIAGSEELEALADKGAGAGLRLVAACGPLSSRARTAWAATGRLVLEAWGGPGFGVAASPLPGETAARALPGVGLRAIGSDGAPLPPGTPGRLEVRGPNVAKGFWRDPEAAARAVGPEGWLSTGVWGAVGADGVLRLGEAAGDEASLPRAASGGRR